jgi:hypothetical protein
MVAEDYVGFEVAKLLKEKGFDGICGTAYETITNEHGVEQCSVSEWGKLGQVKRPTLQMAMKWLREAHNIDIIINVSSKNERKYIYVIVSKWFIGTDNVKRTYEEACEAGIRYCLENLI